VTPGDDTDPRVEAVLDERAEDLFEQAPCGYLSTRPDGTILKVNQTLLDWTGHTRERLLGGVRFQTLLTIGSRIYYETHYAPLLQMQGAAHEIALDLLCAGGRILPAVVNSRQLSDASGVPLVNRITCSTRPTGGGTSASCSWHAARPSRPRRTRATCSPC
jgi:PAS domain S-box-containing protein